MGKIVYNSPAMALNKLLKLIEILSRRINQHRDQLEKSEALTRYALIDPLLRALDWDTEDPSVVLPEYAAGGGLADYALLNSEGKPAILVEAKKLHNPLNKAAEQGIHYTLNQGFEFFVVTDGQTWELYQTHKPVPLPEKRILSFDLGKSTAEACRSALAIWRPAVLDGSLQPAQGLNLNERRQSPVDGGAVLPHPPPPSGDGYMPLPIAIEKLKSGGCHSIRRVRLPDNTAVEVRYWWEVLKEVIQWLARNGRLKENMCPIGKPGGLNCQVNVEPAHPSGKTFANPVQVGSFYFDKHGSSVAMLVRVASMMRNVDLDPARIRVSFRDNNS